AGQLDDALVIVAGDHGEGLMQHGHKEHGLLIYEEAVRVPLVFRLPGHVGGGRIVSAPVQLVDLTPTILDLVGVPPLGGRSEGISLAPVLAGAAEPDRDRPVFLQRRFYDTEAIDGVRIQGAKYAVRIDRWKYIVAKEEGSYELYDLEADPAELRNLYAEHPQPAVKLTAALEDWLRSPGVDSPEQTVSEEDANRLRSLGYVQ
ncbi:MAG: sulfatase family protein, partial [Candidatus Binatia bacterium]